MTNPPDPKTKTPRGKLILEGIGEQNEPATWEGRNGFWVQGDCIFIEAESPQAAIAAYRKETVATSHNHFCGSIMREKDRFRADALELENQSLARRLEEAENNNAILQAKVDDQAEIIKFGSGECDRLNARITEAEKERDDERKYVAEWNGLMSYLMSLPAFHDSKREGHNANRVRLFIDSLTAKLTALRTAAEGALDALANMDMLCVNHEKHRDWRSGDVGWLYPGQAAYLADFAKIDAALAALRAELEGKQ